MRRAAGQRLGDGAVADIAPPGTAWSSSISAAGYFAPTDDSRRTSDCASLADRRYRWYFSTTMSCHDAVERPLQPRIIRHRDAPPSSAHSREALTMTGAGQLPGARPMSSASAVKMTIGAKYWHVLRRESCVAVAYRHKLMAWGLLLPHAIGRRQVSITFRLSHRNFINVCQPNHRRKPSLHHGLGAS